jgi:putative ABC transport system permease protein
VSATGSTAVAKGAVADGRAGPARRAVLRWAWRLFRREWRQQALVLALVTVAVTVAVAGAALATSAREADDVDFGRAHAMTTFDATVPGGVADALAEARQRFGDVEVIGHSSVSVPGSVQPVDLRAQDPHGELGAPLLRLRNGRYPTQDGEVALTDAVASLLGAHIGDRVTLGGVERTVVGMVEDPRDLGDEFALVEPGATATSTTLTLLFEDAPTPDRAGPPPAATEDPGSGRVNFPVRVRGDDGPVAAIVFVAATVAMALVGLIASAGFVVVAHRRQRQLGLLAAIGATERHLRMVVVANGVIVGVVAALVGTALGVVGWIAAAPVLETAIGHRVGRFDLPWGLIAGCAALAVATATLAAWWPARALARLPVTTALSGRPPRPQPVHRSLLLAVALVGLGIGGVCLGRPSAAHPRALPLVAGIAAIVVGVVLLTPAAIRTLAAPARRLPIAARLALRDLVRFQARAAAGLAAIAMGLGIAIAVVAVAQTHEYRADEGNLSDRELLILVGDSTAQGAALDARGAQVAATVEGTVLTLDAAMDPQSVKEAGDPTVREPVGVGVQEDPHSIRFVSTAYVATPEILEHYGIDPATVNADTDLLTSRTDVVRLVDLRERGNATAGAVVQVVDLPTWTSAPSSLVTQGAMARYGWEAVRSGWLVEADHALSSKEIAAARAAAANLGLEIETRSTQDGLATARTVATAAGVVLALAIVAMTIGLMRSETARDLRTLTATGAGARARRALTASTAGALALLGVVLGAVGAYAALVAGYRTDLGELTPLPVDDLLVLAVGLPALATVAGWLLAGREPRSFARAALE